MYKLIKLLLQTQTIDDDAEVMDTSIGCTKGEFSVEVNYKRETDIIPMEN